MRSGRRVWIVRFGVVAASLSVVAVVAIAWWRGRPERHLAEAARLLEAGEPAAAFDWLLVPEARPATRDRALLLRARMALARSRPDEAVGPLNGVDSGGPWGAEADYWKGRTLYAARNPREAVAWYRRSLDRRPEDAEALRWLAAASYDLGDWPGAVVALTEAVRLRPDDARAWRTLGVLYREENRLDQAQAALEASLARDPRQPQARLELVDILLRLGLTAEAERQLDRFDGVGPSAERSDLLAACLLSRGETDAARARLDAALAEQPDHTGLLARRAEIDAAEGRPAEAAARLDRAVAAEPFNATYLYRRGRALRALGRTAESDRDLARASELNRSVEEISSLNKEAVLRPDDAAVRARIGDLSARSGRPEMAGYWYRAALACDPSQPDALRGLRALRQAGPPAVVSP